MRRTDLLMPFGYGDGDGAGNGDGIAYQRTWFAWEEKA